LYVACQIGEYYNGDSCVNCGANEFSGPNELFCSWCPSDTYKLHPSYFLANNGFESDAVVSNTYRNMTPTSWSSTGTIAVVSSTCSILGGMTAAEKKQFAAIRYGGSSLFQNVLIQNSTSYNLVFYASNRPSSRRYGPVAPLLVYAALSLVAAVTPVAGIWTRYQYQFSVLKNMTSYDLIFQVGDSTTDDVMIFLDNVTLISSSCENCEIYSCQAGTYFLGGGTCGAPLSCVACPAGYYCFGATLQPRPCAIGTYNPNLGGTSPSACLPCVSNCSAGTYVMNACASVANSLAARCDICPAHFYCEGGDGATPNRCPIFTSSFPGSTSLSQCVSPTYGGNSRTTSTCLS
jgi:hypothetical protein